MTECAKFDEREYMIKKIVNAIKEEKELAKKDDFYQGRQAAFIYVLNLFSPYLLKPSK